MNMRLARRSLSYIAFAGVITIAALIGTMKPANAQTLIAIAADGELEEYKPKSAPRLQLGVISKDVGDVQILLKKLGFYNGHVSGIYDRQTANSVTNFQNSRDLLANGIVNTSTWKALIQAENKAQLLQIQ